jgi:DNA-binding transcriptional ArsR family regulator
MKSHRLPSIDNLDLPPPVEKALAEAGGFREVLSAIPDHRVLAKASRTNLALSDPTRIRILYALRKCDLCPCVLKRISRISDSKLSYHLSKLERESLITSRKEENWRIYSITKKGREKLE